MSTVPVPDREEWSAAKLADMPMEDALWNAASKAIDYRQSVDNGPLRPDVGYGQMHEVIIDA